jgi:hypothetical protein
VKRPAEITALHIFLTVLLMLSPAYSAQQAAALLSVHKCSCDD